MTAPASLDLLSIAASRYPDYEAPPYFMAAIVPGGDIWVYRSDDGSAWNGELAVSAVGSVQNPPALCVWNGALYLAYWAASDELSVWTRGLDGWSRLFGPAGGLGPPALAAFAGPGGGADCLWLVFAYPNSQAPASALAMTYDGTAWTGPVSLLDASGNPLTGLGQIALAPLRAAGPLPSRLLMGWGNGAAALYLSADGLHWALAEGPSPPLAGFPGVAEVVTACGQYAVSVIGDDSGDPYITTFWGSGAPTVTSWTSSTLSPAMLVPPGGGSIVVYGLDGKGSLMPVAIAPPVSP
jgi:hypothetical protein